MSFVFDFDHNINQQIIEINSMISFLLTISVLILGYIINRHVTILRKFNIPEPIVGGISISTIVMLLHYCGITLHFDVPLQKIFMLIFFTAVGLSANYTQLVKGGRKVFFFLTIVTLYIIIQNIVGISLAHLLDLDPLMGLIAGSISLSGGHGTSAAWADTFTTQYGLDNTLEIAMASATFGLIAGGLIGTPVAQKLIDKHNLTPTNNLAYLSNSKEKSFNFKDFIFAICSFASIKNLAVNILMILGCVYLATYITDIVSSLNIKLLMLPDFVFALILGVLLTNTLELLNAKSKLKFNIKLDNSSINTIGSASLGIFLAMSLISLKLWELLNLAIPFLTILITQTLILAIFAYFVTYKLMGNNYDAAVIASGHCGFGLGATPTAIMNMSSITKRYGSSPKAFIIVPIVGAFFIDITNLICLQVFIYLLH